MGSKLLKVGILGLVALAATTLSVGAVDARTSKPRLSEVERSTPRVLAQIELASPIPLEDAIRMAKRQRIDLLLVEHTFTVGDQQFVGFYPVPASEQVEDSRARFFEAHRAFLSDMVESSRRIDEDSLGDDSRASLQDWKFKLDEALDTGITTELRVGKLTIQGDRSIVNSLSGQRGIRQVTVVSDESQMETQSSTLQSSSNQLALAADWSTWQPRAGTVDTGPSSAPNNRYMNLQMSWQNVSGFGPTSTYEHDFFLNNSANSSMGPGTYLDRAQTGGQVWGYSGVPIVEYAASNLPSAYLDTRFMDGNVEIAYTIGSAKASDIRTQTWYMNYIRTRNGDALRDNAKLTAQLGHRSPSSSYSTWASYGDAQSTIFPAWSLAVPAGLSWAR